MNRRSFVTASFGAFLGAGSTVAGADVAQRRRPIRALLFDGFALFDPRVVVGLAERLYPGKATALVREWRTRQFEYQWLRTLGGRYEDFLEVTDSSLTFAARQTGIDLTRASRAELMSAYTNLEPWPDLHEMLPRLRDRGLSLGILSNMTAGALESGLARAGLRPLFSHVVSTDQARSYKPAPEAYRLGTEVLGLERDEVLFVAFAGWDAAGAVWFGYPTYWLNRFMSGGEELSASPNGSGPDLRSLLAFLAPPTA